MEVCEVWLARDFLARIGRPLDIPPCDHPTAHCPPVKTETLEPPMDTTPAYFNVLDAAEGRNPWSNTPPGATTAPKPYESDACWVSGHEDCADPLCLCQCHKVQTWDPWDEAWKSAAPTTQTAS